MTFLPLSCTAFTSMISLNTLAEYMSKCERDAVNEGWSKLSEGRQLCLKQWGPYNSKPLRFSSILLDNNSLLSKVCLHFTDPLKEIVHKTPSLPYRNKLKVFCSAWTWMESSGSLSKWNVTFHDFSMQLKLWAPWINRQRVEPILALHWHCHCKGKLSWWNRLPDWYSSTTFGLSWWTSKRQRCCYTIWTKRQIMRQFFPFVTEKKCLISSLPLIAKWCLAYTPFKSLNLWL